MFDKPPHPRHPNLTSANTKILNITLPNFIQGEDKLRRSLTNEPLKQKSSKLMNQNFRSDKVGSVISMKNGY